MLKTGDIILESCKRDSYYVNGGCYLKKAKILNELAHRLFYNEHLEAPTPYDIKIHELERLWWENCGIKPDDFLALPFTIKIKTRRGTSYFPVKGGIADQHRKLSTLRIKHQKNLVASWQRIFFKELKHFESLVW